MCVSLHKRTTFVWVRTALCVSSQQVRYLSRWHEGGLKGNRGWSKGGRDRERRRERWERLGIDYRLLWSCQEAGERWRSTAYFPFVCVFFFHTLSFIDWKGRLVEKERRAKDSCHFSFVYPLSLFTVSTFVKISFSFPVFTKVRRLDKEEATQGGKEKWKRERRRDGRKEHTSGIYFITKQSKSAWRQDAPVSNSQIKQALIKTSLSPAVSQITSTNSISWKHTHLTPRR